MIKTAETTTALPLYKCCRDINDGRDICLGDTTMEDESDFGNAKCCHYVVKRIKQHSDVECVQMATTTAHSGYVTADGVVARWYLLFTTLALL